MTTIRNIVVAAVGLSLTAQQASAHHTSYLLPSGFDVHGDRVSLIGTSAEDHFYVPDLPLNVPIFYVTGPSGDVAELQPVARLRDMTIVDLPTEQPGTYRVSTGRWSTYKQNLVQIGDKWFAIRNARGQRYGDVAGSTARPSAEGPAGTPRGVPSSPSVRRPYTIDSADVPPGAPTMKADVEQKIETYVSRGAPTDGPLKTTGEGAELRPITHPNAIFMDEGFAFQMLVDGKPVVGTTFRVYRGGNQYDEKLVASELTTDSKGEGHIAFSQPGVYTISTRIPALETPPGEQPPVHSYTYSLTFEVTR